MKTRTFTPMFDVPGVGDTCYPEMIRQPHGHFLVYNYTSPLDGSDPPWGTALTVGGQVACPCSSCDSRHVAGSGRWGG